MAIELRAFTADDIDAAAALLAARHREHRSAEPLLAARFTEDEATRGEVQAAFERPDASGAVAYEDGRAVGYLLGAPKSADPWGANVWVDAAGQAVEDAEVVRDLYALAAQPWVDAGRTAHYALVPAYDAALVDAWSRLAFGQQQMHAVRESPEQPFAVPPHLRIRRAERGDIPTLAELDLELPSHQARSPVFSAGQVETLEEAVEGWEESMDDPDIAAFVAEHDGRVIGSAVGVELTKSSTHTGLSRPDDAGFLGFAAVHPQARGLGAGRALGEAVLTWCAEAGYPVAVTDWRVTNLLSSRTWPRLGFRPTFVRMHRLIGH